ncbi:MAG: hypothetical protein ACYDC1_20100 [Limisphaerales bacterium]
MLVVIVLVAVVARTLYAFRDRDPQAAFTLEVSDAKAKDEPRPLRAGFARVNINPDLSDSRRPVWVAGFSQNRAATAIHDDLWATAVVIDDGHHRLGIVSLDAIGLFHEDVVQVRRRLAPGSGITYAIVATTHNHNTPDLMGLWGPHPLRSGVDPRYREQVIAAAARALDEAAAGLQAAHVALHEIPLAPQGLLTDTRKPVVFDPDLRVMHFTRPDSTATIGTLVTWANHPETPWSLNTEITSDFCGYLRDALEHGVRIDGREVLAGVGGTHVYLNGAVGGLMTTSPSVTVRDPFTNEEHREPTHAKARALGWQLAARILPALALPGGVTNRAPIAIRAKTIELPVDNLGFLAAPVLGLLDRGHSRWLHMRTEVAVATVGDASFTCIPGEIYPEIVNGGAERAPGGDFDLDPVEVPPIRELMPGRVKFVIGLANDEIGYIIPQSEWDQKPPYLYGSEKGVYGEINSLGPETGPRIHAAIKELWGMRSLDGH